MWHRLRMWWKVNAYGPHYKTTLDQIRDLKEIEEPDLATKR